MTPTDREHELDEREFDAGHGDAEGRHEGAPDAMDPLSVALAERDAAILGRQRALADFANFQRRATENEMRALHSGTVAVVRSLLPALDNLDRALDTDPTHITVDQLRDGVRMVRGEIARALEGHGVSTITPTPGEEFDPRRHEALMRQPAEGIPADHVVMLLQPGYALGETILRPAKVALAQAH